MYPKFHGSLSWISEAKNYKKIEDGFTLFSFNREAVFYIVFYVTIFLIVNFVLNLSLFIFKESGLRKISHQGFLELSEVIFLNFIANSLKSRVVS